MTTPAAAAHYLAAHLHEVEGRKVVIFNPSNRPLYELPVIFGFNNGGSDHWYEAVAIAQDGVVLAGHVCSDEGYMPSDLGIIEGGCDPKHEQYREHYADGYRMEWVSTEAMEQHEGLNAAIAANKLTKEQNNGN
jgi:hypothetical protein